MGTNETLIPGITLNNRYKIISVLGQGGMSNVYLVEDSKLNSRWALKEMLDIFPDEDRTQLLEQFKKEAQILAGLKHPNLPRVFDYFIESDRHYLVMECIEGKTLRDFIDDDQVKLSISQVVEWGIQICDVLASLHKEGIIYRDLKPGNIMVDRNNKIFLIDFGIARLFTGGKIHDTIIIGTPGYASPEHHGRTETDARSDIFSLGATLHYLLTDNDPGLIPFVFKPPQHFNPAVPGPLSDLIMRAVSLDPDERFQSALEMKTALERDIVPILKKSEPAVRGRSELPDTGSTAPLQAAKPVVTAPPIPEKAQKEGREEIPQKSGTPPVPQKRETELRLPFYGDETFTFDPVHAYVYPALFSGGIISTVGSIILLLSGGVLTLPVAAVSALMVAPGAYLYRQVSKYVNRNQETISIKVNNAGIEISQGKRFARAEWDDIIGLLVFNEKSRVGMPVTKYKLFTRKGEFEYDGQIRKVNRFNDIIITHGMLKLAGESGGYRRYVRREGE